mmetsp:Transcript_16002/g.34624  ORF Transcript_16002/g.34624 Transcript_16002/m.34624 type:complete len:201 (+) Transcript_16002:2252-2854(+)
MLIVCGAQEVFDIVQQVICCELLVLITRQPRFNHSRAIQAHRPNQRFQPRQLFPLLLRHLNNSPPSSAASAAFTATNIVHCGAKRIREFRSRLVDLSFFVSAQRFVKEADKFALVRVDHGEQRGVGLAELLKQRLQQLRVFLNHLPHAVELRQAPQKLKMQRAVPPTSRVAPASAGVSAGRRKHVKRLLGTSSRLRFNVS